MPKMKCVKFPQKLILNPYLPFLNALALKMKSRGLLKLTIN